MFSANTNHPIIPPGNEYVLGKKNISIHSDDRDITKWPRENNFAVKLPEAITNVQSIQLIDCSFPINLPPFTNYEQNIKLWIELRPTLFGTCDADVPVDGGPTTGSALFTDYVRIGQYLNKHIPSQEEGEEPIALPCMPCIWSDDYQLSALHEIKINEGTYTGDELASELQFKINKHFECFFKDKKIFGTKAVKKYKYDRFRVVYDKIQKSFKFGNTADSFKLYFDRPNEYQFNQNPCIISCEPKTLYQNNSRWRLGWNLGFCKGVHGTSEFDKNEQDCTCEIYLGWNQNTDKKTPSESYSPWVEVLDGFKKGYYLFSTTCCNLSCNDIIYMELDCYNGSDELVPYPSCTSSSINSINSYGGHVNNYFAKIPIFGDASANELNAGLNLYQSIHSDNPFNGKQFLYKPEERIEKLKVTFRYHNGNLVDFCNHPINFSLNFGYLKPDEMHHKYDKIRTLNF
jgi:hypothetical protein